MTARLTNHKRLKDVVSPIRHHDNSGATNQESDQARHKGHEKVGEINVHLQKCFLKILSGFWFRAIQLQLAADLSFEIQVQHYLKITYRMCSFNAVQTAVKQNTGGVLRPDVSQ